MIRKLYLILATSLSLLNDPLPSLSSNFQYLLSHLPSHQMTLLPAPLRKLKQQQDTFSSFSCSPYPSANITLHSCCLPTWGCG